MKTERFFETEAQRKADERDRHQVNAILICLVVFTILCAVFG